MDKYPHQPVRHVCSAEFAAMFLQEKLMLRMWPRSTIPKFRQSISRGRAECCEVAIVEGAFAFVDFGCWTGLSRRPSSAVEHPCTPPSPFVSLRTPSRQSRRRSRSTVAHGSAIQNAPGTKHEEFEECNGAKMPGSSITFY